MNLFCFIILQAGGKSKMKVGEINGPRSDKNGASSRRGEEAPMDFNP